MRAIDKLEPKKLTEEEKMELFRDATEISA